MPEPALAAAPSKALIYTLAGSRDLASGSSTLDVPVAAGGLRGEYLALVSPKTPGGCAVTSIASQKFSASFEQAAGDSDAADFYVASTGLRGMVVRVPARSASMVVPLPKRTVLPIACASWVTRVYYSTYSPWSSITYKFDTPPTQNALLYVALFDPTQRPSPCGIMDVPAESTSLDVPAAALSNGATAIPGGFPCVSFAVADWDTAIGFSKGGTISGTIDESTSFTLSGDSVQLGHYNLSSLLVYDSSGFQVRTLGTDFTIDLPSGVLTRISGGFIPYSATIRAGFNYTDPSKITAQFSAPAPGGGGHLFWAIIPAGQNR